MFDWFLLMCKNILWPDLPTFLVETIQHFLFWLREDLQMSIIEQLPHQNDKSSQQVFFKKSCSFVLKFLLEQGWNKVAGSKACDFIKNRLQYRCFPVNIVTFLTPVLKNICIQLLLKIIIIKRFLGKPPVTMIITW